MPCSSEEIHAILVLYILRIPLYVSQSTKFKRLLQLSLETPRKHSNKLCIVSRPTEFL